MTETEVKALIQQTLPQLLAQDPLVRDFVLRTVSEYYAGKQETESRFDRVLNELERDRQEQARKWDEQNCKWDEFNQEQARKWDEHNRQWDEFTQEQARKWDEQNRKWDEFNQEQARKWDEQNCKWEEHNRQWDEFNREQARKWDEQMAENRRMEKRFNSTIGALGSRWGLYSEASFRNGLKAILEESFGVQVLNINDFDETGEVFGRPEQIEIDVIITNGTVILCEIKSSMSKAELYSFDRKVAFYQKRHQRPVTRKMVISPMVDERALSVAEALGIEVYSYADEVENLS